MDQPATFTISHSAADRVQVFHLAGILDELAAPELERRAAGLAAGPAARLVLDLSGLRYASSVGIGALITLHKQLHAGGGLLVLANPSNALAEMLVTLNLAAIIPVHATVEHATRHAAL